MRLAVFGLQRNQSEMGQTLRRFKSRKGKAEGITATAHKLARVICGVIKSQRQYDEQEAFKNNPAKSTTPSAPPLRSSRHAGLHAQPDPHRRINEKPTRLFLSRRVRPPEVP
jgi:hypothetical protein